MFVRRLLTIALAFMVMSANGPALSQAAPSATVGAEPSGTTLVEPTAHVSHGVRRFRSRVRRGRGRIDRCQ